MRETQKRKKKLEGRGENFVFLFTQNCVTNLEKKVTLVIKIYFFEKKKKEKECEETIQTRSAIKLK